MSAPLTTRASSKSFMMSLAGAPSHEPVGSRSGSSNTRAVSDTSIDERDTDHPNDANGEAFALVMAGLAGTVGGRATPRAATPTPRAKLSDNSSLEPASTGPDSSSSASGASTSNTTSSDVPPNDEDDPAEADGTPGRPTGIPLGSWTTGIVPTNPIAGTIAAPSEAQVASTTTVAAAGSAANGPVGQTDAASVLPDGIEGLDAGVAPSSGLGDAVSNGMSALRADSVAGLASEASTEAATSMPNQFPSESSAASLRVTSEAASIELSGRLRLAGQPVGQSTAPTAAEPGRVDPSAEALSAIANANEPAIATRPMDPAIGTVSTGTTVIGPSGSGAAQPGSVEVPATVFGANSPTAIVSEPKPSSIADPSDGPVSGTAQGTGSTGAAPVPEAHDLPPTFASADALEGTDASQNVSAAPASPGETALGMTVATAESAARNVTPQQSVEVESTAVRIGSGAPSASHRTTAEAPSVDDAGSASTTPLSDPPPAAPGSGSPAQAVADGNRFKCDCRDLGEPPHVTQPARPLRWRHRNPRR